MNTRTVAESPEGQVFFCTCCQTFHLEFGNVHISLLIEQLAEFWEWLHSLDPLQIEEVNRHSQYRRKIMIPVTGTNTSFLLTARELLKLRGLLDQAIDYAVLPENMVREPEQSYV